jgi:hypothetical protein
MWIENLYENSLVLKATTISLKAFIISLLPSDNNQLLYNP